MFPKSDLEPSSEENNDRDELKGSTPVGPLITPQGLTPINTDSEAGSQVQKSGNMGAGTDHVLFTELIRCTQRVDHEDKQTITSGNIGEFHRLLDNMKKHQYWSIVIDWCVPLQKQVYDDDRPGHEREKGVVYFIPMQLTFAEVAESTVREGRLLTKPPQWLADHRHSTSP